MQSLLCDSYHVKELLSGSYIVKPNHVSEQCKRWVLMFSNFSSSNDFNHLKTLPINNSRDVDDGFFYREDERKTGFHYRRWMESLADSNSKFGVKTFLKTAKQIHSGACELALSVACSMDRHLSTDIFVRGVEKGIEQDTHVLRALVWGKSVTDLGKRHFDRGFLTIILYQTQPGLYSDRNLVSLDNEESAIFLGEKSALYKKEFPDFSWKHMYHRVRPLDKNKSRGSIVFFVHPGD